MPTRRNLTKGSSHVDFCVKSHGAVPCAGLRFLLRKRDALARGDVAAATKEATRIQAARKTLKTAVRTDIVSIRARVLFENDDDVDRYSEAFLPPTCSIINCKNGDRDGHSVATSSAVPSRQI